MLRSHALSCVTMRGAVRNQAKFGPLFWVTILLYLRGSPPSTSTPNSILQHLTAGMTIENWWPTHIIVTRNIISSTINSILDFHHNSLHAYVPSPIPYYAMLQYTYTLHSLPSISLTSFVLIWCREKIQLISEIKRMKSAHNITWINYILLIIYWIGGLACCS